MSEDNEVERTRARMGLAAVLISDVAIALAAILGVWWLHGTSGGEKGTATEMAAVLTSAFTAVSTMTTAYFGIKSISNTASNLGRRSDQNPGGGSDGSVGAGGPVGGGGSAGGGAAGSGGAGSSGGAPGGAVIPSGKG